MISPNVYVNNKMNERRIREIPVIFLFAKRFHQALFIEF